LYHSNLPIRRHLGISLFPFLILTALTAVSLTPMATSVYAEEPAQEQAREDIYHQWEEVSALRSQGEFQQAIDVLHRIIAEYPEAEDILRRANNDLVFTYFLNNDPPGAQIQARVALERFPDLSADPVAFPPRVNETYDQLRREMFGSVAVTKPKEAQILLDGELQGESPLFLDLIPVGPHDLQMVKDGYHDYNERITVDPNGRHVYEVSMKRDRSTGWWLVRGAAVVGAGVLVAALADGGTTAGTPPTEPLPGPPDPPR